MINVENLLQTIKELNFNDYGSDFLLTKDKSIDSLKATIYTTELLKFLHKDKRMLKVFESGLGISIFRDNSTRTRFSFSSAMNALGLAVQDLDEVKSQIAHGETVRETANMISFLAEVIGIRDDMYLGEGHTYMKEVSEALDLGFSENVLHQRPSLINLQCDIDHPTQTMADICKLEDYFGGLDNLRGKKIAMTWAYSPSYGKPMSVPQGIITLLSRFGVDITLAYPQGYDLLTEEVDYAKKESINNNCNFTVTNSMKEAFEDADIVYPKSWAPMHVMQERTQLLLEKDTNGLKDLEVKCLENNKKHIDWECNRELMNLTKNKNALYMHCLPADITDVSCSQGEVSKEVFDQYRRDTYHEASFKPFVIMAMSILTRFKDPKMILDKLVNNTNKRY